LIAIGINREGLWQRCYANFLRNALDYPPGKTGYACLMELRWLYERLNEEIRRRTRVVRIFPNGARRLRLARALAVETHEAWVEGPRYLNMDLLIEHKKDVLRRTA